MEWGRLCNSTLQAGEMKWKTRVRSCVSYYKPESRNSAWKYSYLHSFNRFPPVLANAV
jgi:hypothetical protein